ncbi:MAG: polysaccharide deacetylase family protein [Desulfotomaculaceae bacterium]|nr:polysaccharide deacetylase family protein [Desulfotomaculaceae bacterium]
MAFCLFKFFIVLLLAYAIVPTIIIRLGNIGILSRAPRGEGRIVLTFDDGPDPRYTPRVLEILARYQVKACFFVVGAKAKSYPDIIKQIALAGHEIGNHGFRHLAAWLTGPRATASENIATSRVIEEITGQKPRFYRPPWGLFNLYSLWFFWSKGLEVALWTYFSWDWTKHATPESITRKVLSRIKDGVILILHDSGSGPGAAPDGPAKMLAALPRILEEVKNRDLRVVPLKEVAIKKGNRPTYKRLALLVWGLIDRLIRRLSGIKDLDSGSKSIWRLALRRYRGQEWTMKDGSALREGDYYLEIHINNDRLLSLINQNMSVERMSIIAMREIRNGLPELAELMRHDQRYSMAKILLGITILHRGSERFGFTAYDLKPGLFRFVSGCYEKMLLALFHPGGLKNLKRYRNELSPKYVVMTRQEIMRRYHPDCNPERNSATCLGVAHKAN